VLGHLERWPVHRRRNWERGRREGLAAWRRRRRCRAAADGRAKPRRHARRHDQSGVPPAQPGWFNECRYCQCRSQRAGLLPSVIADLDPADDRTVRRAADALWDALEHCPVTCDCAVEPS
jgi:hypothetical protein